MALGITVQRHVTLSFGKVICRMTVIADPSPLVRGWISAAPPPGSQSLNHLSRESAIGK